MTDRRTGSVGVTVDLDRRPGITLNRQIGGLGVSIDLTGTPALELGVSTTQAQAVALDFEVQPGTIMYPISVAATQATSATQHYHLSRIALAASQGTAASLELERLPTAILLTVEASQATLVSVVLTRGASLVVTTTQSMLAALQKTIALRRATVGNRRVQTSVRLGRQAGRTRSVTQQTAVRLLQQVRLTRPTISQPTSASISGLPVQLELLSIVQTRSLDLGRVISLVRSVMQSTAAHLAGGLDINLLVVQPTALDRHQAADLTRNLEQAQAVSLEVADVTPRYDILVTASVSQQVALGMSDTGAPAKRFVVDTREPEFVVGHRGNQFVVPGRRGRFRVEVR